MDKSKLMLIIGAIVVAAIAVVVISTTSGSNGPVNATGNAKVDNSKKVESDVMTGNVGGHNVKVKGVNSGGDFNMNFGDK